LKEVNLSSSMLVNSHAILYRYAMVVVAAFTTQSALCLVTHTNNHHPGIPDTTRRSVQGLVVERFTTRGGSLLVLDITRRRTTATRLFSLKPAAVPLMDSGKALARSGELLIDMTSGMDLYGGALSTVGALIRNSGDNVAQAAASCRFKTGTELVIDELRQGAESLIEAKSKLQLAAEEAQADKKPELAKHIGTKSFAKIFMFVNGCCRVVCFLSSCVQ
jgi:hypothetical protein